MARGGKRDPDDVVALARVALNCDECESAMVNYALEDRGRLVGKHLSNSYFQRQVSRNFLRTAVEVGLAFIKSYQAYVGYLNMLQRSA